MIKRLARHYINWNWMWNLDAAVRYEEAVRVIKRKKPRVIIEVGSGSNRGISAFSGHPSFGIDLDFNMKVAPGIQRRIRGSGAQLPCASRCADFLISTDVLEHIPPQLRAATIKEMFRVIKKDGVIYITVPVGNVSEEADERVNNAYMKQHKKPHVMLRDHVDNKLPDAGEIVRLVKNEALDLGWKVKYTENMPIWLWELNLRVFAVERWIPGLRHFQRLLLQWAYPFFKTIKSDKNYRIVIVASGDIDSQNG